MTEQRIGIYPDISHKEYHAMDEAVSNSYLGKLAKCPANAKVKEEQTPAMIFGSAFHVYLLEGQDTFFDQYAVFPKYMDRRTKEGKQEYLGFLEANRTKITITEDDYDTITQMTDSVIRHPFAVKLLSEGRSEQSVFWIDKETRLYCKARPDRIPDGNHGVMVDAKSADDVDEDAFFRSIVKYGYHREAAHYIDGFNTVSNAKIDAFILIAVEKKKPYRVETYVLTDDLINRGRMIRHDLLMVEKYCRENDDWPSYQLRYNGEGIVGGELIEVDLRSWAA